MIPLRRLCIFLSLAASVLLLAALGGAGSLRAAAGINHQISFQGKVVNTDGTQVANGSYSFTFSLYTVATGGTATWTESKALTVTDGVFQTNLGSATALPGSVDFNADTWYLGITFNSDGEMSPRVLFTAVPQAFNAEKVGGLSVTNTTGSLTIPNSTAVSFAGAFSTSGTNSLTLTTTAATSLTLPSGTGTLADTATSQTLTNKTLTSPVIQGAVSAGTGLTLPSFTLNGTVTGSGAVVLQSAAATGLTLDSGTTGSISIGTSANAKTITIGNSTAATALFLNASPNSTTNNQAVAVGGGASLVDTGQTNFILDNSATYAETASTCSSVGPVNTGAQYYNSTTQTIRACVNGSWQDLVSTGSLILTLFGVVPSSGAGAEQGDIASTVVNAAGSPLSGPCKVSWASSTTVTWRACTAYSGGRLVQVLAPGSAVAITATASAPWQHLCLTGTNGQPALTAANASETANMPTFSPSGPVLCLATVRNSGAATPLITNIYDTRTFSNTNKVFATINAASAPGFLVKQSGANLAATTVTASDTNLLGVVVATGGAASTTSPNAIVAVNGPAFVKAVGTSTATQLVVTATTAGYSATTTTAPGAYGSVGVAQRTIDTACSATNNCQYSQLLSINPR